MISPIVNQTLLRMGGIISCLLGNSSRVIRFKSSSRWHLYFNSTKDSNKLIVVDFTASWYTPCKLMKPVFIDMAEKYKDVDFVTIDVDEVGDVASEYTLQELPTFVLLKQGKEVERVVGADKDELERKIIDRLLQNLLINRNLL